MKCISVVVLAILISMLVSCQSEYQKLEKKELASGKIENELYLGLELGMTKKQFFTTCWNLNKKRILNNGPSELSVEYKLTLPSGKPAEMRFYPKFKDERIYEMPIEFSYDGWAPWNEELNSENLSNDVKDLFEEWYGPGFIEVSNTDKSQVAQVKVDGNRRVRIYVKHTSAVRVDIVDLNVIKDLNENPS
ncbi:hypothetical protein [uncultured Algoriphagus sp.]|uniref:hypothetical protein n=1 Tax=uncultured Algoriphagus sp. TaxID=417365 RepID=UPI0030ED343C|tara:strand:- start:62948 stop:63520 length:573 start_codon:yes stop_codon:yes gene_type:complete